METMQFKLEDFEGPLDLLLFLVSKNKMNIYDIEILALIDQYLAVVNSADDTSMESASEFIELAAKLVQMKSYFLLPKSEEAERLREELTGQLIEYSICKSVAAELRQMSQGVFIVVREPQDCEQDFTYRLSHDVSELSKVYTSLTSRAVRRTPPRQEQFDEIVQAPFVSVTSRIVHVLKGLATGKINRLRELFANTDGRSKTVATFLAVLELMRAGRISIDVSEKISVAKRIKARK